MECQAEKPGCKHSVFAPNIDVLPEEGTCDAECAGQRDGLGLKMGIKKGEPLCFLKPSKSSRGELNLRAVTWNFGIRWWGQESGILVQYVQDGGRLSQSLTWMEVGENDGAR